MARALTLTAARASWTWPSSIWTSCRCWPAWKCVGHGAGYSYPGTPTLVFLGSRPGALLVCLEGTHTTHPGTPFPSLPPLISPALHECLQTHPATMKCVVFHVRRMLKVRRWPAWKCSFSPVSAHIQAHQPDMGFRKVRRWPAWKCVQPVKDPSHPGTPTLFHVRLFSIRCAVGPPGNTSFMWSVPHIQSHQPSPPGRAHAVPGAPLACLEVRQRGAGL